LISGDIDQGNVNILAFFNQARFLQRILKNIYVFKAGDDQPSLDALQKSGSSSTIMML